jgi:hypothetical protein
MLIPQNANVGRLTETHNYCKKPPQRVRHLPFCCLFQTLVKRGIGIHQTADITCLSKCGACVAACKHQSRAMRKKCFTKCMTRYLKNGTKYLHFFDKIQQEGKTCPLFQTWPFKILQTYKIITMI